MAARQALGVPGAAAPRIRHDDLDEFCGIWIAASAMQFGLRLVTTDGHYRHVPQIAVELHDA